APRRVKELAAAVAAFWRERLGQSDETRRPLRIPFVDFARGDGVSIGPGQEHEWTPVVIDETTPWVSRYRGLWGLFARDPISGENAPAGPMYERDGTARPSWFDPLGFAGLAQVTPPPEELRTVEPGGEWLQQRESELDRLIDEETGVLRKLGVQIASLHGSPHLAGASDRLEAEETERVHRLSELRKEKSENLAVVEALRREIEGRGAGDRDDPRAHIRHAAEPVPESAMRFAHATEVWAAISISLLLLGLAALVIWSPSNAWAGAIALVLA